MKRPEFIARQAGHPTGIIGALLARIMAKETANENGQALTLLDLQPSDDFLEIGAGHGATLKVASRLAYDGFLAGIDISDVMVRRAKSVNRSHLKSGKMEIARANSNRIPYPDNKFDKAMAVHTIYFWSKPKDHFDEVFRILAPGGLFLLCFRPAEDAGFAETFPETVYHIRKAEVVIADMKRSGFEIKSLDDISSDRGTFVFALGQKPASG